MAVFCTPRRVGERKVPSVHTVEFRGQWSASMRSCFIDSQPAIFRELAAHTVTHFFVIYFFGDKSKKTFTLISFSLRMEFKSVRPYDYHWSKLGIHPDILCGDSHYFARLKNI